MSIEESISEQPTLTEVSLESAEIPKTESTEITRYDPLRRYMAEIGKFMPLSRDEGDHSA